VYLFRRHMRSENAPFATAAVLALIAILDISNAHGATGVNDAQQLRADAAARATEGPSHGQAAFGIVPAGQEDSPNFTFTALLPTLYNSNANSSDGGATSSFEYNPEVRFAWKQAFAHQLTISALVDVNSDRYPSAYDADSDTGYGRFRIQHVSGSDDQEAQPFIEYSPRLELSPFFSGPTSTVHDVRLGLDQAINYQDAFQTRAIRKQDSSDETVWAITYTVDIWRRHTNSGTDSTRLELDPTLSWYPLGEDWNASLEFDFLPTLYDQSGGSHQHDISTNVIVTFEYAPAWLPKAAKLDFQIMLARADSTLPNASFQQWVVGPLLRVSIPL
jgi:hypothetical protein